MLLNPLEVATFDGKLESNDVVNEGVEVLTVYDYCWGMLNSLCFGGFFNPCPGPTSFLLPESFGPLITGLDYEIT